MNIKELSEHYKKELKKHIPEFNVLIQIDNNRITIECIQIKGETKNYLFFDFWKGKGSLHRCESGISIIEIERILMPLLVEYEYVGKIALKNKYHNTIKSDSENNRFNPGNLVSSNISSKNEANEQISKIEKYINEIAMPFFNEMGNLNSSFSEILKLDNDQLHKRLNPIGAIQRKMIIQYQVDKSAYHKEYDKYTSQYIAYYKDGMDEEALKFLNLTKKLNTVLIENG